MGNTRISNNGFVATVISILVTLAASWVVFMLDVPNPVNVLVVVMILFTVLFGRVAGAASGICIIGYALFFFSDSHGFTSFSGESFYKCCVIVVSLVAIYLLVAIIHHKAENAFNRLASTNEQLEEQNQLLQEQSDHDVLTGLFNRRGGESRTDQLFGKDASGNPRYAYGVLVAMDIDDFKQINDSFGHAAGDQALQFFVERLNESFPADSVLIRTGGDEFQMILASNDDYAVMEDRLHSFAAQTFKLTYDGHPMWFYISCGYALYPLQGTSIRELGPKADRALYAAKRNGKHQALRYDAALDDEGQSQLNFLMRNLTESLPVSFMVYRADESERILMVSNSLLKLCECKNFSEFMAYSGGTFSAFVYPDDVDKTERGIGEQIRVNRNGLDEVDYRIITKGGRVVNIHDLGRLVHDPVLGDLFYVVLYDRDSLSADLDGAVDADGADD